MRYLEVLTGAKLDIRVVRQVTKNEEPKEQIYLSSVLDVNKNEEIIINMPSVGGRMTLLPENVPYEMVFTTASGVYKSVGRVIKKGKKDNFYVLVVKLDREPDKIQRREYFRLEVLVPLIFNTIPEGIASLESMKEVVDAIDEANPECIEKGMGTILDISGGGLRFISTYELQGVEYLTVRFQLGNEPDAPYLELVARLLDSRYKEEARKFEHRVKFIFKDNVSRETIIKYIFDEERRIRKKSLG